MRDLKLYRELVPQLYSFQESILFVRNNQESSFLWDRATEAALTVTTTVEVIEKDSHSLESGPWYVAKSGFDFAVAASEKDGLDGSDFVHAILAKVLDFMMDFFFEVLVELDLADSMTNREVQKDI